MKKEQFKAHTTEEIKDKISYLVSQFLEFRQRRAQTFYEGYEHYDNEVKRDMYIHIAQEYESQASAVFIWALNGGDFYSDFLHRVSELDFAVEKDSKPTRTEVDEALWGKAYKVKK